MTRDRPFRAVIFDMDGVLTRTARLHEQAWKEMFDPFLREHEGQRPFSSADYRAHVDGKPRYQGVSDFLASRELALPHGDPSDAPDAKTICGLGNRKNAHFLELLESEGVEVFDDAVQALGRWQRGGLKAAAVSSSRNCRRILRAADLERRFDVIVDGQLAAQRSLRGKAEIMMEAALRLEVDPSEAVVFEDATAGVRAARRVGFGLVVGVARAGNERDLEEAGAHTCTTDVYRVHFLRCLPSALDRIDEISARRQGRPLAIFLDFDGTLAPIVDDPADAHISDAMRATLKGLRCPVAIISGRDRNDVAARVGIDGLFYAGNHGFDIAGRGQRRTLPEAEDALADVDAAQAELERRVGPLAGVILERKRYSLAVHYRKVRDESTIHQVRQAVEAARASTGLRMRTGKMVLELEPAVDWNKGRALEWLVDVLPVSGAEQAFVVYAGDDETDEDAFAVLRQHGAGVRVGAEMTRSLADYRLAGSEDVLELLRRLGALCEARPDGDRST